jgi:sulfite reductase (NADPH) flavoprotein alpha-component
MVNTEPTHLALAGAATAGWLLVCFHGWWRRRARILAATRLSRPDPDATRPPLLVAYASQTGASEAVAIQTATALQAAGVDVLLRSFAQLDAGALQAAGEALLIASTYGEGDPPDNAARFVSTTMRGATLDLSRLRYGLLAMGDRNYRNFCGFGRELDAWLQAQGAQPLFPRIDVDCGDAEALTNFRHQLSQIAATTDLPDWQETPYESWTLSARRHLNPGSAGGPVYHLELTPPPQARASWQPGDLLQLLVPADPDRARDFSIASIPEEGAAHLLVRVARRADGSVGLASGWLTMEASIGATVPARLRAHSNFQIGSNAERDLILIGNGTGLAGLRAHLRQRAAQSTSGAPTRRHWLIFGERQAAHDAYYGAELKAWQDSGLLTRLDLVYSRDGQKDRYVQDRLRAQHDLLRTWIEAGAAVYVCGSLEGMAAGVAAALREILGETPLARLQHEGRYRRDVY